MSGAVVVMRQNGLLQRFRDANATDAKSARTLADIGCRDSWIFRRMVTRGVFIETGEGRYFLDEDASRRFVKRRWLVMVTFIAIAAVLFALVQFSL